MLGWSHPGIMATSIIAAILFAIAYGRRKNAPPTPKQTKRSRWLTLVAFTLLFAGAITAQPGRPWLATCDGALILWAAYELWLAYKKQASA
jgi:multisubunit Na+/H+ antiporter MnhB subunit